MLYTHEYAVFVENISLRNDCDLTMQIDEIRKKTQNRKFFMDAAILI
jgi:hypothetical protein